MVSNHSRQKSLYFSYYHKPINISTVLAVVFFNGKQSDDLEVIQED